MVRTSHTFAQIADAIDTVFARWDRSHLHEFTLSDGRRVGVADDEFGGGAGELDEAKTTLSELLAHSRDAATYTFDLGAGWEHECTVLRDRVDARAEYGRSPTEIVPVFGWGVIPDQYGRNEPGAVGPD